MTKERIVGVATIAGEVGRGLVAGFVGTAVMTASQMLEQKLQGGEDSQTPAQAVEQLLDVEPKDEEAESRLTQLTHFAYGTAWGGVRGAMGGLGMPPMAAHAAHFVAVTGAGMTMLPSMGLAPKPTQWPVPQLVSDVVHHAVYAVAVGLVYEGLRKRA